MHIKDRKKDTHSLTFGLQEFRFLKDFDIIDHPVGGGNDEIIALRNIALGIAKEVHTEEEEEAGKDEEPSLMGHLADSREDENGGKNQPTFEESLKTHEKRRLQVQSGWVKLLPMLYAEGGVVEGFGNWGSGGESAGLSKPATSCWTWAI